MNKLYYFTKQLDSKQIAKLPLPKGSEVLEEPSLSFDTSSITIIITSEMLSHSGSAVQIIPCLSILSQFSTGGYHYQVSLVYKDKTYKISDIGEGQSKKDTHPLKSNNVINKNSNTCFIYTDDDSFIILDKITEPLKLIFKMDTSTIDKLPSLLTLSITDTKPQINDKITSKEVIDVDIPVGKISQRSFVEDKFRGMCSPVSTAMVINHIQQQAKNPLVDVMELAEHILHPEYNYRLWPAAIYGASRFGIMGYVHRLSDIQQAIELLQQGYPLVTSLSFNAEELKNSPIDKPDGGHLVVLRGIKQDEQGNYKVIVNDPASENTLQVTREYDYQEFANAWIHKRGAVYVLFTL